MTVSDDQRSANIMITDIATIITVDTVSDTARVLRR